MTETVRTRMTFAVIGTTVLIAVLAVGQGLKDRPQGSQEIVRLIELARDVENQVAFESEPAALRTHEPFLVNARFPGALKSWTGLRTWLEPALVPDPLPLERAQEGERRFITLEGEPLLLAQVIPVNAGQPIAVEMTSRWRGEAVEADPTNPDTMDGFLGVLPMKTTPDLAKDLATRSLQELWEYERCVGQKQPIALGPATADAGWQEQRMAFRPPLDARSLLLVFSGGATAASIDLQQITIRATPVRHLTGFAGTADGDESLADVMTGRMSLRQFGIESLTKERPWIASVDGLAEQRDAFVLPPPASVALDVNVPDGDVVLEFGVTRLWEQRASWPRGRVDLTVTLEDRQGAHELHHDTLRSDGPTGWQDREIDLSRWAGQTVRLSFATMSKNSLDLVAVGSPLIRRRASGNRRPNVILVSLDTLRADHLGIAGYPRPTTPNLDELARRNLWFSNARSTCSYTLPAHGSMMTGQLPSLHGAINNVAGTNRLSSERSDLLAVRLRDAGYLTAAFTGGHYVNPTFGFAEGFDRYSSMDPLLSDDDPTWRLTPTRTDPEFNLRHREGRRIEQILEWIRTHRDSEFFLFLHTYVIHNYMPGHDACARFHDGPRSDSDRFLAWKGDKRRDHTQIPEDELAAGVDLYDATLFEADRAIGGLVQFLKAQQLWYDTILIVTSDHGEEFLDHGRLGHGRSLYDEQLHVPLIVHLADAPAPRVIDAPVSILDIVPTVMELLDLEPRTLIHGQSLLRFLDGEHLVEPKDRPLLSELYITDQVHWRSTTLGPHKAIQNLGATGPNGEPIRHLFHTKQDPDETLDLATEEPAFLQRLIELGIGLQEEAAMARLAIAGEIDPSELSEEMLEQLRQAGYFE